MATGATFNPVQARQVPKSAGSIESWNKADRIERNEIADGTRALLRATLKYGIKYGLPNMTPEMVRERLRGMK